MAELSVIIPVKNEEENIIPLNNSLKAALHQMDYEVIWVDDGSTDDTTNLIKRFADERTLIVELARNYGQSAAMKAGIDHSSAKYIAFLDGDGQNDPLNIPEMLSLMKTEQWDMVAGNRKKRKDALIMRKLPSRLANSMIRLFTGVYIKDYGCTLKVITAEKAKLLDLQKGMHRFIPVLIKRVGGRITELDVNHHPRIAGKSKYGLERIFSVLKDLIILIFRRNKISTIPIKNYTVRQIHTANCPLPTAHCPLPTASC